MPEASNCVTIETQRLRRTYRLKGTSALTVARLSRIIKLTLSFRYVAHVNSARRLRASARDESHLEIAEMSLFEVALTRQFDNTSYVKYAKDLPSSHSRSATSSLLRASRARSSNGSQSIGTGEELDGHAFGDRQRGSYSSGHL